MQLSRRQIIGTGAVLGVAAAWPAAAQTGPESVERWGVHEIVLQGPASGNPFVDVTLSALFSSGERTVRVPGFYDGDGTYRIRFSPPDTGEWNWRTASNVPTLNNADGRFTCIAPNGANHGPVRVSADGFHFVHADGTPFRQIGTTAYSWALQSDAKCRQTLETLAAAPFNKMRMLVFPNVASVATDPFVRTGRGLRDWDPARFDPAYFRRYEDRIRRLGTLGIEADVILYHPYDAKRGYSDMTRADDERYVRYVAARFGAYRNVWWSMANEYDIVESKTMDDWDHLFRVLVDADPHDRLRSIHQIHTYYDHRKPWITHASVQNGAAVLDDLRAELHRAMTGKPVVFDEVVYEGNAKVRWGNLTGQDMVERFWWGLIGGTYVGHSETFSSEQDADTSWLGQGGVLRGTSAPRLAFLRRIMEEGPRPGIDAIQPWWNYHIAGQPGRYYLKYFGAQAPADWAVAIPSKEDSAVGDYRCDVIDTWNMTVTPAGIFRMQRRDQYDLHDPARPGVPLGGRYMAVRLVRV